jgi:hypothetical protein
LKRQGELAPNITKGYHALTERRARERGERERESDKTLKCISQEKEPSALLHFRWRSGELKGGPNANEMQFHATLSLPLFTFLAFILNV